MPLVQLPPWAFIVLVSSGTDSHLSQSCSSAWRWHTCEAGLPATSVCLMFCQISQISNHIFCCKEPSGSKNLNTCNCAALIYRVWKPSRDYSPCFPGFWYQLSCRLVKTSFTFVVFHLRLDSGAFKSAAVLSPHFLLSFLLDFWCRVDSCSWTRSKLCRIPMESASGWANNMFTPFCKGPVCLHHGWKRAWNHLVRELRRVWLSLFLVLRRAVLGFGGVPGAVVSLSGLQTQIQWWNDASKLHILIDHFMNRGRQQTADKPIWRQKRCQEHSRSLEYYWGDRWGS